jgi:hypothetical protein
MDKVMFYLPRRARPLRELSLSGGATGVALHYVLAPIAFTLTM